ncbi:protocadherin delta 1 [Mytilus galloprovincialis]|uniref:Protocadherin delta 1 n=1 Tax=Mytilus galloprovincialis TaxID=29158 RepID=A0A8B6CV78_MYTGA|nr:protocadherin delta 1 [Mytilus galloprovincialis]
MDATVCLILALYFICFQFSVKGQTVYFNVTEEQGSSFYIGNIAESAKLQVADTDLKFTLLSNGYPLASQFSLDETTSDLVTVESLDRDMLCAFDVVCTLQLAVVAKSESTNDLFSIKVFINLKDINDNSPLFAEEFVSFELIEGTPVNTSLPLEGATDRDSGMFGVMKYGILDDVPFQAVMDTFADGRSMLKLVIIGKLDREQVASYQFQVLAYDGGEPTPNIGTAMFSITVTDINDNYPKFTQDSYNKTIYDDSLVNMVITRVFATDLDEGLNGLVRYRLSSLQTDEIISTFSINETSGEVYLKESLITRSKEYYRVIVEASDSAKQPLIAQSLVFVRVFDHHNNFPEININLLSNKPHAEISEQASQGATVAHLAVADPDTGDNGLVTCMLTEGMFRLQKFDTNEYKIVVFTSLDRETEPRYNVTVVCEDTGNPPKKTNKTFIVVVLDENDNEPEFIPVTYRTHLLENNKIGVSLLQVSAVDLDLDQNAKIEYTLQDGANSKFSIDNETGQIFANQMLDREIQEQYIFQVFASDHGNPSMTGTGSVSILVDDVNDNAPEFRKDLYSFPILENSVRNIIIGKVEAFDVDDKENGEISYSISTTKGNEVPFIVMQNGSVLVTIELDREKSESYNFQIVASDQGNSSLNTSVEVFIKVEDENDNSPVFVFPNKDNNTIIIPYKTPSNSVVGTFRAYDNDSGMNSRLSFYLNNENISDYLLLNSYNGELFLVKDLSEADIRSMTFEVVVQDHGEIPSKARQNLTINITHQVSALTDGLEKNFVVAIAISSITIFLALLIIFMIFLLRRQDIKNRTKLHESQESQSQKTNEGEEAGFIQMVSPVYYPPTYILPLPMTYSRPPPPSYTPPVLPKSLPQSTKFNTIQRSISVQQEVKTHDASLLDTSSTFTSRSWDPPLWENGEVDDVERQRNKLISIEYQRSLLRIQHCKRSNSVLTI